MPRGPRLDTPGTLHHVILRGIERRKVTIQRNLHQVLLLHKKNRQFPIKQQTHCLA